MLSLGARWGVDGQDHATTSLHPGKISGIRVDGVGMGSKAVLDGCGEHKSYCTHRDLNLKPFSP
jgi:hypothetical protein